MRYFLAARFIHRGGLNDSTLSFLTLLPLLFQRRDLSRVLQDRGVVEARQTFDSSSPVPACGARSLSHLVCRFMAVRFAPGRCAGQLLCAASSTVSGRATV
jgi:hypothetical protein